MVFFGVQNPIKIRCISLQPHSRSWRTCPCKCRQFGGFTVDVWSLDVTGGYSYKHQESICSQNGCHLAETLQTFMAQAFHRGEFDPNHIHKIFADDFVSRSELPFSCNISLFPFVSSNNFRSNCLRSAFEASKAESCFSVIRTQYFQVQSSCFTSADRSLQVSQLVCEKHSSKPVQLKSGHIEAYILCVKSEQSAEFLEIWQ